MAYITYNNLWENEFDNIVSEKGKVQDIKNIQLKLEVHGTYKKDEKKTTDFEPINNEEVINKTYLDENLLKINGHSEKNYNEVKLQYNKQSVEAILFQKALKTFIQIL